MAWNTNTLKKPDLRNDKWENNVNNKYTTENTGYLIKRNTTDRYYKKKLKCTV